MALKRKLLEKLIEALTAECSRSNAPFKFELDEDTYCGLTRVMSARNIHCPYFSWDEGIKFSETNGNKGVIFYKCHYSKSEGGNGK